MSPFCIGIWLLSPTLFTTLPVFIFNISAVHLIYRLPKDGVEATRAQVQVYAILISSAIISDKYITTHFRSLLLFYSRYIFMFRAFFNLMQNPLQAIVCILYVEQFLKLVNAFSEKSLTLFKLLFKNVFHIALFCTTLLMMRSINATQILLYPLLWLMD